MVPPEEGTVGLLRFGSSTSSGRVLVKLDRVATVNPFLKCSHFRGMDLPTNDRLLQKPSFRV